METSISKQTNLALIIECIRWMRAWRHAVPDIGPSFDNIDRDISYLRQKTYIDDQTAMQVRKHFAYKSTPPKPHWRPQTRSWFDDDEHDEIEIDPMDFGNR